jgi:hypothetical protein
MNVAEGASRMKRAGRWMILIALAACVFLLFLTALSFLLPQYLPRYGTSDMILLLLFIAFPGAFLWLAGWILEGFAKETH